MKDLGHILGHGFLVQLNQDVPENEYGALTQA